MLIGRLLQGFSAGVELGGVSIYLFEIATPGNKGFYTSFQSASQQVAIFFAAIIGFALSESMPADTDRRLGLAHSFFIGCLIVPFIFVIRRSLEETPEFLAMKKHPTASEILASMVAELAASSSRHEPRRADHGDVLFHHRLYADLRQERAEALRVRRPARDALVAVTNFIWLPIGGAISDRIGRKPVLLTIAILALVTAYPALRWLVGDPTFSNMLAVEMLFSFYFGMYNGAMVAALSEIVPAHVRASGFSLAFSLAAALFGTFTPFASTFLIKASDNRASPGFWLMFASRPAVSSQRWRSIAAARSKRAKQAVAAQQRHAGPKCYRDNSNALRRLGGALPAVVPAIRPNTAPASAGAAGIVEVEQAADQFAGRIQAGDGAPSVSMTRALVSIFTPPKVNVTPQVTAYASNGGSSTVFAQFDLGIASPRVPRPSLTLGSNGTSVLTAVL